MAYTQADADLAARHVKEGLERVEILTINIELARQRGEPTHIAERGLATVLVTLEKMMQHEEDIRTALSSQEI